MQGSEYTICGIRVMLSSGVLTGPDFSSKSTQVLSKECICLRRKSPIFLTGGLREVLFVCITWLKSDSDLGHLQARRLLWSPDLGWSLGSAFCKV